MHTGATGAEGILRSVRAGVGTVVIALAFACGGDNGGSPVQPDAPAAPAVFDAVLAGTNPAPGNALQVGAPNDTPVSLEVVFSVTVPAGQAGTYSWNTALQADHPPDSGFVVPVVTTAFQPIPLVAGVQTVTVTAFHTTNALCYDHLPTAAETLSLDIDVRAPGASLGQRGPQVLGKQFDATWTLQCQ